MGKTFFEWTDGPTEIDWSKKQATAKLTIDGITPHSKVYFLVVPPESEEKNGSTCAMIDVVYDTVFDVIPSEKLPENKGKKEKIIEQFEDL